jgi:hypothetical protein
MSSLDVFELSSVADVELSFFLDAGLDRVISRISPNGLRNSREQSNEKGDDQCHPNR